MWRSSGWVGGLSCLREGVCKITQRLLKRFVPLVMGMVWTKVKGFANITYLIKGVCYLLVFPLLVLNQRVVILGRSQICEVQTSVESWSLLSSWNEWGGVAGRHLMGLNGLYLSILPGHP